jgi:glycerol-3-phosphate dehydrogenase (NAD(P)+)
VIAVIGAGAFGTALAVALARGGQSVTLWTRDAEKAAEMQRSGRNEVRLPGVLLPENMTVTADFDRVGSADIALLCLPTQSLRGFLDHSPLRAGHLVACCKGVDLSTRQGPTAMIRAACPAAVPALITGPSFAADIARGLPTALTLACADDGSGTMLQENLSNAVLRLYRTTDVTGAELGGALKNVIAIAAGMVIGAGLGESARAALMTRGFAEMSRLALALGARPETLAGLSGLGDLVLTCTSTQSRNFRYGRALGAGDPAETGTTVEGVATARAVTDLSAERGIEMPVTAMVSALLADQISLSQAISGLMSRPLKKE